MSAEDEYPIEFSSRECPMRMLFLKLFVLVIVGHLNDIDTLVVQLAGQTYFLQFVVVSGAVYLHLYYQSIQELLSEILLNSQRMLRDESCS